MEITHFQILILNIKSQSSIRVGRGGSPELEDDDAPAAAACATNCAVARLLAFCCLIVPALSLAKGIDSDSVLEFD